MLTFQGQNNLPLPPTAVVNNRLNGGGGNGGAQRQNDGELNGVNNHIELRRLKPKEEAEEDVEELI